MLKINQLNIKITKRDYKKMLVKDIKVFLMKRKKKVAIWLWTVQKSQRRWKANDTKHEKQNIKWEKAPHYNHYFHLKKRIFSWCWARWNVLASIRNFFYFAFKFGKLARLTKSAIIPGYENSFILLISSHSRV